MTPPDRGPGSARPDEGAGSVARVGLPLWLGRRFTRGASGRYDVVVILCASFLAALVLAGIAAVPGVVQAQRDALAAQLPQPTTGRTGIVASYGRQDWRDRLTIDMVRVGLDPDGTQGPAFPGIDRLPGPGETVVSPALAAAMTREPGLARAIPGTVVGTIDTGALVSSRQEIAVVGVPFDDMVAAHGPANSAFGMTAPDFVLHPTAQTILAVTAVVGLVLLPLTAFLASAAGQLAGTRATRARLLEVIGVRRRRARWLVRADAVLATVAGVTAALLAFPIVTRIVTDVRGVPMAWTSGQVDLTGVGAFAAYALPLLTVSLAGLRARRRVPIRTSRRGLVPAALGVVSLLAALVGMAVTRGMRAFESQGTALTVAGTLFALVIGAALLIGPAIALLGRLGLVGTPGAIRLLAAARLARSLSSAGRASGWVVAAFLFALAISPIITATAPYDEITERTNAATGRVVAFVEPMPPAAAVAAIRSSAAVSGMLVPGPTDEEYVADCATIRRLLAVRDCEPGQRFDLDDAPLEIQAGWESLGVYDAVAVPDAVVDSVGPVRQGRPLVLLTPDAETYWSLVGDVMTSAPTSSVSGNTGGLIGGPDQLATRVQAWLRAGLVWSVLLAGAIFALGMVGDVTDRLRTQRALRAVGASDRTLRAGLLAEQGVRVAAIALFTLPLGALIAIVSPRWLNRDAVPLDWIVTCAAALAAVLAAGTLAALVASRLTRSTGHHAGDASMIGD